MCPSPLCLQGLPFSLRVNPQIHPWYVGPWSHGLYFVVRCPSFASRPSCRLLPCPRDTPYFHSSSTASLTRCSRLISYIHDPALESAVSPGVPGVLIGDGIRTRDMSIRSAHCYWMSLLGHLSRWRQGAYRAHMCPSPGTHTQICKCFCICTSVSIYLYLSMGQLIDIYKSQT